MIAKIAKDAVLILGAEPANFKSQHSAMRQN